MATNDAPCKGEKMKENWFERRKKKKTHYHRRRDERQPKNYCTCCLPKWCSWSVNETKSSITAQIFTSPCIECEVFICAARFGACHRCSLRLTWIILYVIAINETSSFFHTFSNSIHWVLPIFIFQSIKSYDQICTNTLNTLFNLPNVCGNDAFYLFMFALCMKTWIKLVNSTIIIIKWKSLI